MIILEGPDGGGKTTLLKKIKKAYPALLDGERACTSAGGPVKELAKWTDTDMLEWGMSGVRIYDRYPVLSEPIYGPVIKGELPPKFGTNWLRARNNTLRHMALIIWCIPPFEVVERNASETARQDPSEWHEDVAANIDAIHGLYTVAAVTWPGQGMIYDYTSANPKPRDTHLANLIRNHLLSWGHF